MKNEDRRLKHSWENKAYLSDEFANYHKQLLSMRRDSAHLEW